MRIAILTLVITLMALPIMAKSFDNSAMAAQLMKVVAYNDAKSVGGETEVASLAAELNAIDVGAGQ